MMLAYLIIVLLVLALFAILLRRSADGGWPPGPSQLYKTWSQRHEYTYKRLAEVGKEYGGFFSVKIFGIKFVVINDWTTMKEALLGQSEVFSGRPDMYLAKKMFWGTDILFVDGPQLKEKRRFVLHHLKNLGFGKMNMEANILEQILKLLDAIEAKTMDKPSRKVLINGLFFLPVFNILYGMIAGKQYDNEHQDTLELSQFFKDVVYYGHQTMEVNAVPWLRFLPSYAHLVNALMNTFAKIKTFLERDIDRQVTELKMDAEEPSNFMDAYLIEIHKRRQQSNGGNPNVQHQTLTNSSSIYTKDHLIGVSFELVQAGTDTTASTLEWALLYMALWPEIQTKMQQELDRIVGRDRLPSYADHNRLPYLMATILEIHRYSSVVPLSGPHCTMTSTTLAGFKIPKRTRVIQNIWAVHNDPNLWTDPQTFRPERFIDADGKVHKPDHLIPFSLGARACIGETLARQMIFLFMACLLQRFRFNYACGEPPPTLKSTPLFTRYIETVHLVVERRQ